MESNTNTCTIDETNPHQVVDAYKIGYNGQKVIVKLTHKDYNPADPTWFSLSFAWYNSCIPNGEELVYNYITSVVSSSQEIVFQYNGRKFSHLLVDQIQKDPTKKQGFTVTIETQGNQPAKFMKEERVDRILSDVVASRCIVNQPSKTSVIQPYEGFRGSYKVVDYGDPKLSFYGIIIAIANCKTEIVEALEFDNLKDFYIMNEEPGTTQLAFKQLLNNKRIMLKRTQMSNEPFSFTSQYKAGTKTVKNLRGGGGCHGDHGQSWITPEQKLIISPPIEKTEKGAMTKEKGAMTKTKEGNSLKLPTKEKGVAKTATTKGSVKPAPKTMPKAGMVKGAPQKRNISAQKKGIKRG